MNMPKLTEITEAMHTAKVLEVLSLLSLNENMNIKNACRKVGISEQSFRRWMMKDEEAILAFQNLNVDIEKYILGNIIMSQSVITQKLINDAKDRRTAAGDRLSIKRYLDDQKEQLLARVKVINREIVTDTFSGPPQILGESTNRLVTETNEDGSVTVKSKPIIDGKFLEDRYESSIGGGNEPPPSETE